MDAEERAALGRLATQADLIAATFAPRPAVATLARALATAARAAGTGAEDGADEAGAGEAERALRRDLGALAEGEDTAWARALSGALAGGGAVPGGAGRAIRARAGDLARRSALAGEPSEGTLALLLDAGLLGPYLAAVPDGEVAGQAAARALAPRGAGEVGAASLCEGGPEDPGHWPVWAAVLRRDGGRTRGGDLEREAWYALVACARTRDDALRAAYGDAGMARPTGRNGELGALGDRLPAGWRADALARRLATCGLTGNRRWDARDDELADRLPAWARRRATLRAITAAPGAYLNYLGTCGSALWGGRREPEGVLETGAGHASRVRCARLLARLPVPACRGALRVAGPGVAGAEDIWREIAANGNPGGAREAAWLLAEHGGEGSAAIVRAALGCPLPHDWELEVEGRRLAGLLVRRDTAVERAAAEGLLDACRHHPRVALELLQRLGAHAPAAGARAAARLLATGTQTGEAAGWLVRHTPEWASARALAAGGLLPGGEGGAAGRRAHRALARAWKGALGPDGAGN